MDKYERYELEQKQKREGSPHSKTAEVVEVARGIYALIVWTAICLVVGLAAIYGLVRFIKWAWSD